MEVPRWFRKELELIDRDYFCVWDGKKHRWQIRWWKSAHSKRDLRSPEDYLRKSIPVLHVCYFDENHRDCGYHQLDNRVLHTLKLRKHYSELSFNELLALVDGENEKLAEKVDRDTEDMIRQASQTAYNTMTKIWSK